MERTGRWKAGMCLPVLLAMVILVAITPASAFSATLNTPTSVQPGDHIKISLGGLANDDIFKIEISSNNLVNTDNSYRIQNFSMPFGFQTGTSSLSATGTNVADLSMHIETATDRVTYETTGGPILTVSSSQNIHKTEYFLIVFSGTPYTAGNPVDVSLVAQGTVTGSPAPANPADLDFILQGASSGNIRVQINSAPAFDQVFTISTPTAFVGSDTKQTLAVPSGSTTTLDLTAKANTSLTIKAQNDIGAGTSLTVTQYSSPPGGSTTPSSSSYNVLGKYMTIESSDPALSAKIGYMVIKIKYDPAEIPSGVSESNLKVYYYGSSGWEALPGYPGVGDTVDTVNKFVIGNSTHLSVYAILAAIAPPPSPPSGGSTGGSGGGGYFIPPVVTAAPYKTIAKPTAAAPTAPVAEVTTIPQVTAAQTVTQAATATATPAVPVSPLAGILGVIVGAGIFVSLRRH